jgi:predicted NodU family carbamoyl transferase
MGNWDDAWKYRHDPSGGRDPKAVKELNVNFDVDVRVLDPNDPKAATPSDQNNYIRADEIHAFLDSERIDHTRLTRDRIAPTIAILLASNEIVAWFQGRKEIGPRALGARSILANPSDPSMKDTLNARIKHRCSRPGRRCKWLQRL